MRRKGSETLRVVTFSDKSIFSGGEKSKSPGRRKAGKSLIVVTFSVRTGGVICRIAVASLELFTGQCWDHVTTFSTPVFGPFLDLRFLGFRWKTGAQTGGKKDEKGGPKRWPEEGRKSVRTSTGK